MRVVDVTREVRPFTLNGERTLNRYTIAAWVKEWRDHFNLVAGQPSVQALLRGLGPIERAKIAAVPTVRNAKSIQDAGGCFPAAKAALDGLVDAGILLEDGPKVVRSIELFAPVLGAVESLTIYVVELAPDDGRFDPDKGV